MFQIKPKRQPENKRDVTAATADEKRREKAASSASSDKRLSDAAASSASSAGSPRGRAAASSPVPDAAMASQLNPPIGTQEIRKASEILSAYKTGKQSVESRVIENEQFWKLRYSRDDGTENRDEPSSAWLWNCIVSKHADMMDGYPEPNILPREQGDESEARMLSAVLPVVLEQNDYRRVYSDVAWYKLKQGTGVTGVFWDASRHNGMGDIAVKKVDLLNLFWEPGITDIQSSRNVFCVELTDNETITERYPQSVGKLGGSNMSVSKYIYDDTVDTSDKSLVIDWYYKRAVNGRTVLHYVKYVGDTVLYATENDSALRERGLYDHGKYPFVFDSLFDIEGSPGGYGYTDICKGTQRQIDALDSAVRKNALMAANRRYFVRGNGAVNEEEFLDWTKPLVHTLGGLGDEDIKEIKVNPLGGTYVEILSRKIEELKETSGNRDVNNGGTASGVTAASAIAAMQEQAGKTSRDILQHSYAAFSEICTFLIELIRQFYDFPRSFRITGEQGSPQFITYTNSALKAKDMGGYLGSSLGIRLPCFDVEVTSQKANPYSKISQNELALQLYQLGFFSDGNARAALACLEIMDFSHKDSVIRTIGENAAATAFGEQPPVSGGGTVSEKKLSGNAFARRDSLGNVQAKEPKLVENARRRAAEAYTL